MWLNLVELSVWVREVACSNRVIPISGVEQSAARQAHNLEVGGSSPPPATVSVVDLVIHQIVVLDYAGSNPVRHLKFLGLTQLGECHPYKLEVVGSNPTSETRLQLSGSQHSTFNRGVMGSNPIRRIKVFSIQPKCNNVSSLLRLGRHISFKNKHTRQSTGHELSYSR